MYHYVFQKRNVLEEGNQLELRVSALDEDLEDMETSDEEEAIVSYLAENKKKYTWSRGYKTFFMLSSAETEIYPAHKC